MSYAILVYFDPVTEAKLQALKDRLAFPGSNPTHLAARPHISLTGCEVGNPADLAEALWVVAGRTPVMEVLLSSVGVFPTDEGVVFIAPAVTGSLLNLHAAMHRLLDSLHIVCHPYYRPDTWVPHATITMNIPAAALPNAIETCRNSNVFGPAWLEEISLISYPPFEELDTARFMA